MTIVAITEGLAIKPLAISWILAVVLAMTASSVCAQPSPSSRSGSVVKVDAKLERQGPKKAVVIVSFEVKSGWYLFANPPGNEEFESAMTRVKVTSITAAKVRVDYPRGEDVEIAGEKWRRYVGQFEVRATVESEVDPIGAIEVAATFHANNQQQCLLPDRVKISLK